MIETRQHPSLARIQKARLQLELDRRQCQERHELSVTAHRSAKSREFREWHHSELKVVIKHVTFSKFHA